MFQLLGNHFRHIICLVLQLVCNLQVAKRLSSFCHKCVHFFVAHHMSMILFTAECIFKWFKWGVEVAQAVLSCRGFLVKVVVADKSWKV